VLVVSRSYYGAHPPVVQSFHHPPETPRQPPTPILDASLHWLCSCEQVRSPRRVQAAESGFEDQSTYIVSKGDVKYRHTFISCPPIICNSVNSSIRYRGLPATQYTSSGSTTPGCTAKQAKSNSKHGRYDKKAKPRKTGDAWKA